MIWGRFWKMGRGVWRGPGSGSQSRQGLGAKGGSHCDGVLQCQRFPEEGSWGTVFRTVVVTGVRWLRNRSR